MLGGEKRNTARKRTSTWAKMLRINAQHKGSAVSAKVTTHARREHEEALPELEWRRGGSDWRPCGGRAQSPPPQKGEQRENTMRPSPISPTWCYIFTKAL